MEKSITRRIIAVSVVVAFLGISTYRAVVLGELDAYTAIVTASGLVTGYYFGVKKT